MAKLSLQTITSGYAALDALNINFGLIAAALDNTVSRDGTSPNQLSATLDANSQRLLNLPAPASATEPVRLGDVGLLSNVAAPLVSGLILFGTGSGLSQDSNLAWDNANKILTTAVMKVAGTLPGQGSTANRGFIDSLNGMRFFAVGADAATQGAFAWTSYKGDGTNALGSMSLTSTGVLAVATNVVTPLLTLTSSASFEVITTGTNSLDISTQAATGGGINISTRSGAVGTAIAIAAATPDVTFGGTVVAPSSITAATFVASGLSTSKWQYDGAGAGTIAIANNGTVDLATGSGMVFVHNDSSGTIGVFLCFAGSTTIVSDPSGVFSVASGAAGKTNLFFNGGTAAYRLENKTGGAVNYYVTTIRTRTSV